MSRILTLILIMLSIAQVYAQVNAYARVTAVSSRTLTLANVNETYGDTFENGEQIVIMQMQDDVLGTNTSNTSSFGTISAIGSAGLFEVLTISSMVESSGTPTSITVTTNLVNTYLTGVNARLQIISFRSYGSPNYTLSTAFIAATWNGNTGGVIAIQVAGTLTMGGGGSISADSRGFAGGARSTNFYSNSMGDCYPSVYASSSTTQSGAKGEGIFNRNGDANYANGRARIANGGGGGNHINAGGGGGSNYTSGGTGGGGWSCGSSVGGDGGAALNTYISASRVFMGGGGGGGQQNDSNGGVGGTGGGIVLIKANSITTSGSCSGGRLITANAGTGGGASNDGAGGGGAGGSIVFQVPSWSAVSTCTVEARANGGNGGNVSDGTAHGGGGGGGQGRIIFSSATPSNVNSQTNNGTSGCNNGSCATSAPSPGGTNGSGVSVNAGTTALPVTLLYFTATFQEHLKQVTLNWATATEKNNKVFVVEKSTDGKNFMMINEIIGSGTTLVKQTYDAVDFFPATGISYYRLRQIDFDDTFELSNVVAVRIGAITPDFEIYPNPVRQGEPVYFRITSDSQLNAFEVLDSKGIMQYPGFQPFENKSGMIEFNTESLKAGVYILKIRYTSEVVTKKFFVQ
jgi:hypothetical protein